LQLNEVLLVRVLFNISLANDDNQWWTWASTPWMPGYFLLMMTTGGVHGSGPDWLLIGVGSLLSGMFWSAALLGGFSLYRKIKR